MFLWIRASYSLRYYRIRGPCLTNVQPKTSFQLSYPLIPALGRPAPIVVVRLLSVRGMRSVGIGGGGGGIRRWLAPGRGNYLILPFRSYG